MGTTPVIAKLERKQSHLVRLELDGYQPYETTLTKSVSGWVWGNLVFGGPGASHRMERFRLVGRCRHIGTGTSSPNGGPAAVDDVPLDASVQKCQSCSRSLVLRGPSEPDWQFCTEGIGGRHPAGRVSPNLPGA